ncbi:hypothetical protein Rhow_008518 [Rhodococcus wratislaviensis]|uniref:Uncharacterized protein n=1 Tax=Rhodococcus wratislaviensis TaxID=44752 RepID=A0A402CKN8_RHOWR|nr:amidohydrolase family protein [Rhodococcus wratislaviensis]GCE44220.1 hypothetical protein Rhow_008518 [Rhodococcus wratislaviensis]
MTKRYLIVGGHVSTMDDELGDFREGAVLVEGDRIVDVGPAVDLSGSDAEIIDARGGVVLPGMVDTHRHTASGLPAGVGVDDSLLELLSNAFDGYLRAMTPEDVRLASLIGGLQAIDSGVTTVLDPSDVCRTREHAAANLQGLIESGIRGFFGYGMNEEAYPGVEAGPDAHAARLRDIDLLRESETELVKVAMSLTHPGTGPFDLMAREIDFAREREMLACSHTAPLVNSRLQNDIQARYDRGLLLPGHVYIHVTALRDREWKMIAETGGYVSISPETEMQMGMGFPPFRPAIDHGLAPSLSSDTVTAGAADFLSQMRLGLQTQRALDHHAVHARGAVPTRVDLTVRDAYLWGSRNGADAVGLGAEIGTLTPGKRADVIVVNPKRSLLPIVNPLGTVVLHGHATDVETVIINGEIRKRHGRLLGHDLDAIRDRARTTVARILDDAAPGARATGDQLEALVDSIDITTQANIARAYMDDTASRGLPW